MRYFTDSRPIKGLFVVYRYGDGSPEVITNSSKEWRHSSDLAAYLVMGETGIKEISVSEARAIATAGGFKLNG